MMEAFQLVIIFSPAICGYALSQTLIKYLAADLYTPAKERISATFIATSYLALGTALNVCDSLLGSPPYLIISCTLTICATAATSTFITRKLVTKKFDVGKAHYWIAGILTLTTLYVAWHMPAVGWDTTSFWASVAVRILDYNALETTGPFIFEHRHPANLSFLLSWIAWLNAVFNVESSPAIIWMIFFGGVIRILWTFATDLSGQGTAATWLLICLISTPLIENHIIGWGYSELPLALLVLTASILMLDGLQLHSKLASAIGLSTLWMLIELRNTGVWYAASIVGAFLLFATVGKLRDKGGKYLGAPLWLAPFAICPVIFFIIHITATNAILDSNTNQWEIGGRMVTIASPSANELFAIYKRSWFENQSFSVLATAVLFVVIATFFFSRHVKRDLYYWMYLIVALIGMQHFSLYLSHGLEHAMPNHDTGFTRFQMPVSVVMFCLLMNSLYSLYGNTGPPQNV